MSKSRDVLESVDAYVQDEYNRGLIDREDVEIFWHGYYALSPSGRKLFLRAFEELCPNEMGVTEFFFNFALVLFIKENE